MCAFSISLTTTVFSQRSRWRFEASPRVGGSEGPSPSSLMQHHSSNHSYIQPPSVFVAQQCQEDKRWRRSCLAWMDDGDGVVDGCGYRLGGVSLGRVGALGPFDHARADSVAAFVLVFEDLGNRAVGGVGPDRVVRAGD